MSSSQLQPHKSKWARCSLAASLTSHACHHQPTSDSTGSNLEKNPAININLPFQSDAGRETAPGSATFMQEQEPGPGCGAWGQDHNNDLAEATQT